MELMDSSGTIGHGTKWAASEPIEEALFDERSSPKRKKKVMCDQTTASQNPAAPPYVPGPTGIPEIHSNAVSSLNTLQGKRIYTRVVPASSDPSAKSSRTKQDDVEDKSYIKKPLNAFMLFRAEQRPKVVQELQITDSAKVNAVLGQRWKMLSEQEQAPYYEQALREKKAHEAKYPGWSNKDNYGKNTKRKNNDLPVAPTFEQPVMQLNSTHPMSFINQPMSNQVMYHQAHGNQAMYHQAHGNQALHNQAMDNHFLESQPLESHPLESHPLESQPLESHPLESQPLESQTLQHFPVEAFVFQGKPMEGIPLEAFMKQACDNDVQVQVLQSQPETSALYNHALPNQSLSNQALENHALDKQVIENQAMIQTLQDLPVETFLIEGMPMQGIPLEAFMKQACDNDIQVQVLQSQPKTSALDKQATENQAMIQILQHLPMETFMFEGIPVQGIPLETFMKQTRDNNVHVQVIQSELGTSASTTPDI